ncbi:MAG: hypothetical protein WCR74_21950 [Betaproteobacteria bacterium]
MVTLQGRSEKIVIIAARFHADGFHGGRLVQHFDGGDAAFSHMLDFHGPTRGDITAFNPVIDHGTIEAEAAGDFSLATENSDETFSTIHGPNFNV